jgi:hypothetical protein
MVQFVVHCLYIQKDEIRYFQKAAYSIVENDTAGIQSCMYSLLLAQTEVFLHESCLNKRFTTSAGNTTGLYKITILQGFFQQLLCCPLVLDWCLYVPSIWIMTEETTHGTSLHEGKETDAGTIDSAEGFYGVDTTYVHFVV